MNRLKLVKLSEEYRHQLFEMMDEWTNSSDTSETPGAIFKNDYHDFDHYLRYLEIKEPTTGKVPDSTFFALDVERNIFVGAINIPLNTFLISYMMIYAKRKLYVQD